MVDQNCIFCRIIAGEIPAQTLYEDQLCIAFRDLHPQAPVHVLVIPRAHIESLNEAGQRDEPTLGHLLRVAARVAGEQGLEESGFRTVINTGAGVGQSVFHLHLHVLGGREFNWPPG
ncbi:MAG: histidine triad nucleotide-binding protein [Pyrinomonadaceae bacterium]|nr:histidine triad nucleotide-binding protein [Pyrinomonadaceae bacterium]